MTMVTAQARSKDLGQASKISGFIPRSQQALTMLPFLVPFLPTASKPTDPKAFTTPATSLHSGNGNDEALGSRNLLLPALCAADTLRVRASAGREAADWHWWFTSDRTEGKGRCHLITHCHSMPTAR